MEVLVAMAIVAVAITVVIEVFSSSLRLAGKSQDYSRAAFYGRQLLEEVCLKKDIAEGAEEGVFEGDFSWRYEITPHEVLLDQGEAKTDFVLKTYNISVTVFWPDGESQKTLTLVTRKMVIETEES